jgi:hypothetical protein
MSREEVLVKIAGAVAEAIKELGQVPSGHLYAALMGQMSLDDYNAVLSMLRRQKLVRVNNHLVTWIGGE